MKTTRKSWLPPELMAEIMEAAERAAKGIRDPEIMKKARERMDKRRAEIFRREGRLDIGVSAIRELRGGYGDDE